MLPARERDSSLVTNREKAVGFGLSGLELIQEGNRNALFNAQ